MTGAEAFALLAQGKKVRRLAWVRWHVDYIYMIRGEDTGMPMIINVTYDPKSIWKNVEMAAWQFLADDWEVVE